MEGLLKRKGWSALQDPCFILLSISRQEQRFMGQKSGPELAPVVVIPWSIGEVRTDEDSFIISFIALDCSPN